MCFTPGPTSDQRGTNLTDGVRTKLLLISGPKPNKSKLPASRRSSSSIGVKSAQTVAKVVALTEKDRPSRTAFNRLGSPADISAMDNTRSMTSSVSRNGVQSERFANESDNFSKQDKKVFTAGQFVSKIKTKQMKGMITGVGKELRRAATTVGEKLPGQKKKQSREEKQRQELLGAEPQKPMARNPDEIKKAYGYAGDTKQAASMVHDKLRERGEKLSAIQRQTTELEGDAANFAALTQDLVKKMECKKWAYIDEVRGSSNSISTSRTVQSSKKTWERSIKSNMSCMGGEAEVHARTLPTPVLLLPTSGRTVPERIVRKVGNRWRPRSRRTA